MRGQRIVDVVLMSALGFYAVVERIAKVPFGVRGGAWLVSYQKWVIGGQKGCNITWGYVAWMIRGMGGGQILGVVGGVEG
jgi:hypothetical protein